VIERADFAYAIVTPGGSSSASFRRRWQRRLSATRSVPSFASGRGSKRVIVVGAGLAGLCAAYELAALGTRCDGPWKRRSAPVVVFTPYGRPSRMTLMRRLARRVSRHRMI
jgi:NADPH-dependent 2,4-dienoyl-CoA reductase/sulfur reductase-like enzyme